MSFAAIFYSVICLAISTLPLEAFAARRLDPIQESAASRECAAQVEAFLKQVPPDFSGRLSDKLSRVTPRPDRDDSSGLRGYVAHQMAQSLEPLYPRVGLPVEALDNVRRHLARNGVLFVTPNLNAPELIEILALGSFPNGYNQLLHAVAKSTGVKRFFYSLNQSSPYSAFSWLDSEPVVTLGLADIWSLKPSSSFMGAVSEALVNTRQAPLLSPDAINGISLWNGSRSSPIFETFRSHVSRLQEVRDLTAENLYPVANLVNAHVLAVKRLNEIMRVQASIFQAIILESSMLQVTEDTTFLFATTHFDELAKTQIGASVTQMADTSVLRSGKRPLRPYVYRVSVGTFTTTHGFAPTLGPDSFVYLVRSAKELDPLQAVNSAMQAKDRFKSYFFDTVLTDPVLSDFADELDALQSVVMTERARTLVFASLRARADESLRNLGLRFPNH